MSSGAHHFLTTPPPPPPSLLRSAGIGNIKSRSRACSHHARLASRMARSYCGCTNKQTNMAKRKVCCCLGQIAKHSVDLAEVVVEAEVFPNILKCLRDSDLYVRKNAATCIREIAKHTPEVRKLAVEALERRNSVRSAFLAVRGHSE